MKRCIVIVLLAVILFSVPASADMNYSDVHTTDWFYTNVESMNQNGCLNGYPDGSFRPNNDITAAEFVSVTARVKGILPAAAQNEHWAGGLLAAALNIGWYDWDEIPPTAELYDKPICRELAAKIVMRAFLPDSKGDYSISTKISDFTQLNGRYYNEVLAAYAAGVATGDEGGNFNPKSSLTRAEACAFITRAAGKSDKIENGGTQTIPSVQEEKHFTKGGVSYNGRLSVQGTQLVNERGEAVILRGMSSHGIQWFPQFLSKACIKSTSDRGANLFRIAMYTEENGYIQNNGVKQLLINTVDIVTSLDMYVIIDWHILSDGNPNLHIDEAKRFFAEMAEMYQDNPAVIYEICNEPNGSVSWSNDVKPYAEELIETIRSIDKKAVILVGSPTWSQDLHEAAKNPLSAGNIMYTCHFYAGTHTKWLRDRIKTAMDNGIPVFVSEWGTSDASGSGGVYADETETWISFMNQNGISWANWSLCNKNESSAALKSSADGINGITEEDLSESGKIVWSHFSD